MDSKRLAEIADVMEDRGLTRVRVEEPDGTAVELERASAAQPVAVPMPMPSAMAAPVAAPTVAPAAPEPAAQTPAAAPEPKGTEARSKGSVRHWRPGSYVVSVMILCVL